MLVLAGIYLSYVNTGGVYVVGVVDRTMSPVSLVPRGCVRSCRELLVSIYKGRTLCGRPDSRESSERCYLVRGEGVNGALHRARARGTQKASC
jgi:hypothetical protein